MGLYKNTNGVLTPIAGRGKAEYGASTIRTGTLIIPTTNVAKTYYVTFDDPMPDADYIVEWAIIICTTNDKDAIVGPTERTASGFGMYTFGNTSSITITWKAFKLYTDNEYNNLLELETTALRNNAPVIDSLSDFLAKLPNSGDRGIFYLDSSTMAALTDNRLNGTGKIVAQNIGGGTIDWFGFSGASAFAFGRYNTSTGFYNCRTTSLNINTSEEICGCYKSETLYRKTFEVAALGNNTSLQVGSLPSNANKIINIYGTTTPSTSGFNTINFYDGTNLMCTYVSGNKIYVKTNFDARSSTAIIIVEYTKTAS